MIYTVQNLMEASGYKEKTITKILTKSSVSNHFELTSDNLQSIYDRLEVVSFKARLLKNYLRDELAII